MTNLTRNGTAGRVYGGDEALVHIKDGERHAVAAQVAGDLDYRIRSKALRDHTRTITQLWGPDALPLCPGCTDVVLFDVALELCRRQGRPVSECARTLANAFTKLAEAAPASIDAALIEEIEVILDPCDDTSCAPSPTDLMAAGAPVAS